MSTSMPLTQLQEFLDKTGDTGIETLAEFCGVEVKTIQRWASGEFTPRGGNMLSLRVGLNLAGYVVHDYTVLKEPAQDLAKMLCFGIITQSEALEQLGYEDDHAIYRMLLRAQTPMREQQMRLERIVKDGRELIDEEAERWQKKFRSRPELTAASTSPTSGTSDQSGSREDASLVLVDPLDEPRAASSESFAQDTPLEGVTVVTSMSHLIAAGAAIAAELDSSPRADLLRTSILNEVGPHRVKQLIDSLGQLLV